MICQRVLAERLCSFGQRATFTLPLLSIDRAGKIAHLSLSFSHRPSCVASIVLTPSPIYLSCILKKGVLPGLAAAGRGAVHLAKAALRPAGGKKSGTKSKFLSSIRKHFNNKDKTKPDDAGYERPSEHSHGAQRQNRATDGQTNVTIPALSSAYMSPYVEDAENEDEKNDDFGRAHKAPPRGGARDRRHSREW